MDWVCDKHKDCTDGSDEIKKNCHTNATNTVNEYLCQNNKVVSKELLCNGEDNCGDGSDEAANCSTGS